VIIDSHCHLADAGFADELPALADRAQRAGVEAAICILGADDPEERARASMVAQAWPSVRFAAGVHPHHAGRWEGQTEQAVATVADALRERTVVAIGEIGLDYHYDFAPRPAQLEVFAGQAALAAQLGLPVIIHARESIDDTLAVLGGHRNVSGVMHCFTGNVDEARRSLDLGLYISLSGIVTFPKSSVLRRVAEYVPADRLLVETDAPFLAPVPHRGRRNEPAWVRHTCELLASLRATTVEALAAQLTANTEALFARFRATALR
jgi:TatD DNase family protein